MKTRLYNARILTMTDDNPIFQGEVHVEDAMISYVGAAVDGSGADWEREMDCRGNLLMPGFKNAHTHSGMTLLRSYADDLPLSEWLEKQVWPIEEKLNGDDIYHLTRLAILEYLTSGITAIFEMYITPDTVAAACQDMGMRCVQVGAANDFGTTAKRVGELYETLNGVHPLTAFHLGFHAEYTCQESLLQEIAELARHHKAPVFTHLAETQAEVAGCVERHGKTPAVYLDSLGIFDHGGGGYHCVHMSDTDTAIFREKGLYAVTNPASNLKLASGIAPINTYLKEGIPVAIGTDGPASNNCLDMFREMFLVSGLAKVKEADAAAAPAMEILKMACVNGARCMGLSKSTGISVGQYADLIVMDLQQPNMQPLNNIAANVVYSGSKQNVALTMIHGRILYENGEFAKNVDVGAIYQKANEIIERVN